MHLSKVFYFLYFGATASLIPYLSVYYHGLGLPGSQIGALTGIPALMTLVGAPIWSALADITHRNKLLLALAIAGAVASAFGLAAASNSWALLGCVLLFAFCVSPIIPLIDYTVMEMLHQRRDRYGQQRVWGAVGWGLTAPLAGIWAERLGLTPLFAGYIILMTANLFVVWRLPISQSGLGGVSYFHGMRRLLSDSRWIVFLVIILISGVGQASIHNFLFLHIESLGGSKGLMGWALTFATFSEVPAFIYASRLAARWRPRGILIISLVTLVLRTLIYSWIAAPWMVLPVQLLHGLTFSAMWTASVSYAQKISPPGLGATGQGLITAVFFGLAGVLGSLTSGLLFESIGSSLMYRWIGIGVSISLVIFALAERRFNGAEEASG